MSARQIERFLPCNLRAFALHLGGRLTTCPPPTTTHGTRQVIAEAAAPVIVLAEAEATLDRKHNSASLQPGVECLPPARLPPCCSSLLSPTQPPLPPQCSELRHCAPPCCSRALQVLPAGPRRRLPADRGGH